MKKLTAGLIAACALALGLFASDIIAQSCTLTPNMGLCKGARGAAEWDIFLNSNFDLIDAQTLNTGTTVQTKTGSISFSGTDGVKLTGTGFAAGDVLFLNSSRALARDASLFWDEANNRLGIGTGSPTATLDVSGTVKMTGFSMATGAGSGEVLTSDGSGNGTWQAISGAVSGWTPDTGKVVLSTIGDKVGIGVASPIEKLEVSGGIKVGNSLSDQEGTIRWNGSHFQGSTGITWVDLDYSATSSGGWTDGGSSITLTTASDKLGIGMSAYSIYKMAVSMANGTVGYFVQTLASGYGDAILDLNSTWNAGTASPNALSINIVDTSSAATSNLIRAMVGSDVKFSVHKSGAITSAAGLVATTGTFSGALEAATIKLTSGASAGYVLTSDASGNGTWQASGAGVGIPSGMIAIFDTSCPSGWTSLSGVGGALNGKFPYGGATYGAEGGTSTHAHVVDVLASFSTTGTGAHGHTVPMGSFSTSFNDVTEAVTNTTANVTVADNQHYHTMTIPDRTIASSGDHTHNVHAPRWNTTTYSTLPSYITVVYCKKN